MNKQEREQYNKTCHEGHRKRLLNTVDALGLCGLSDVQALEFILFFTIPRGDVNPLAHRLLDRFHDVPTVLEASVEDLMEVDGVGEAVAKKLHAFNEIFFYYSLEKINHARINSVYELYEYLETLLRFRQNEELFMFGVDQNGKVTQGRRFSKGSNNLVTIDMREISLFLSTYKVPGIVVVHNHPDGQCLPSETDKKSYNSLKDALEVSRCKLVDSIIVGNDGIFSMAKNQYMRMFNGGIEYMQAVNSVMKLQESM